MRKIFYFLVMLLMASVGYSQKAEKYCKKGDEKFQDQNFQTAIDYYSKAIKIDPKFAEAYLKRGRSKGELHEYVAQFVDCRKAIEINPSYAEAYYNRGIAKIKSDQNDGGCSDFKKAKDLGYKNAIEQLNINCP
jgi:tetratricopeptide (TPR) repeat protein